MSFKRMLSRVAAVGLLILLIQAFSLGFGYPLIIGYRLVNGAFTQTVEALHGYQRVAGHAAALRNRIEALERDRSRAEILLPAGSDGAATAALQDHAQSIIGAAGAWLTSVQPLPATLENGHRRMGLRLAFSADIGALRDILLALEHGRPVMILEAVNILARSSRAIGEARPLEVRIDVFAYKPEGA